MQNRTSSVQGMESLSAGEDPLPQRCSLNSKSPPVPPFNFLFCKTSSQFSCTTSKESDFWLPLLQHPAPPPTHTHTDALASCTVFLAGLQPRVKVKKVEIAKQLTLPGLKGGFVLHPGFPRHAFPLCVFCSSTKEFSALFERGHNSVTRLTLRRVAGPPT